MKYQIPMVLSGLLLAGALLGWVLHPEPAAPTASVLGQYYTPLTQRTAGQRLNCVRAASALEGKLIQPGGTLSFNHTVGQWTASRGYVQAPVSYDGQMEIDWGGGVCQTSSALYNAALIAGLDIVQRHPHNWAPTYAPVGRDAAVAQPGVDLVLHNPHPYPVRLHCTQQRDGLVMQILGREAGPMASVSSDVSAWAQPSTVLRYNRHIATGSRKVVNKGMPGLRAFTTRRFIKGPRAGQTERLGLSVYPVMNRLVLEGR